MKKPDSYFCDICGIARSETNHWRLLLITKGENLQITAWESVAADVDGVKHSCGNSCTQKLVERFLQELDAKRLTAGGAA